jgi:hypothetical protein
VLKVAKRNLFGRLSELKNAVTRNNRTSRFVVFVYRVKTGVFNFHDTLYKRYYFALFLKQYFNNTNIMIIIIISIKPLSIHLDYETGA